MKYVYSIMVLVTFLNISSCAYDVSVSTGDWSTFLQRPDADNAGALVVELANQVADCGWGSSGNQLAFPSEIRQDLFDLISNGNSASLKVGLYVERCLDGGDLGDFRRSAGQCFDKNPNGFLREMRDSLVSTARYKSMLTMLPLTLVDDLEGQIAAIRHRISQLRKINSPAYIELKEIGISALKDQEGILIGVQGTN